MRNIVISLALIIILIAFSVIAVVESNVTSDFEKNSNLSSQEFGPIFIYATKASLINAIFPLENNSSISSQGILLVEKDFRSIYNKDFDLYSPIDKRLIHHFFALNKTVNCTIMLSYYGNIGFLFCENNISSTSIAYLGENQSGLFFGIQFAKNIAYNNCTVSVGNNSYGYVTNVNNLSRNITERLATYYYLTDFARYYVANKELNKNNDPNFQKLMDLEYQLENTSQSSKSINEKLNATANFYKSVKALGYSDEVIINIINDLDQKNLLGTNPIVISTNVVQVPDRFAPLWYILEILLGLLVLGVYLIWLEHKKNKEQGKTYSIELLSQIIGLAISGFILPYTRSLAPSNMTNNLWSLLVILVLFEICILYWGSRKIENINKK